jgi:hypothetical protein
MNLNDLLSYIAVAISILGLAGFLFVFGYVRNRISGRLERLFAGSEAANVGALLTEHGAQLNALTTALAELSRQQEETAATLADQLRETATALTARADQLAGYAAGAIRHVHLHAYRVGGSSTDSMVVTLADAAGNGLLLNVLAGKPARVFPRTLRNWCIERPSQDEEKALAAARRLAGAGEPKEE